MKKILTFLLMVLLAFSVGWAAEVTLSNANIVSAGDAGSGYASWTMTDDNGNTWNAYAIKNQHSNATSGYHYLQIKKYASSTAYYIQVPELGTKITQIVMTVSSTSKPMDGGGNTSTLFFSSSKSTSATGTGVASGTGSSSVTINCSSLNLNSGYITASAGIRIWDVTVTYETGSTPTVAPPTITPNGGNFVTSQEVELSHADADAIYYTLDGTTPSTSSTQYTVPFTINATTTVTAIAVKDGVESAPATATFTKTGVATITEALAVAQGSTFTFTGNAVVTYQNGRYVWIRDNSGSGLIFRNSSDNGTFNNGDILEANWTATNTTYQSVPEFTNPTGVTKNSSGGSAAPFDKTSTGITSANVNEYVSFSNITLSWDSSVGYCYVTYGNNKVYFKNTFFTYNSTGLSVTSGHTYNIEGIAYVQSGNVFVYMTSVTEVVTGNPLITVDPLLLNINDSGTGNNFTVEASNLVNNEFGNVGVNASSSDFSLNFSSGTNETATWGFLRDNNGAVNGTVTVSYIGRELSATGTVTSSTQGASATVDVNYRADLYIVGDYGNGWDFSTGTPMTYDATNNTYTASVTVDAGNLILFARKYDTNDLFGTRYVFGPNSGGDCWVSGDFTGTIDLNDDDPIYFVNSGTYIIEINATTGALTITKEETPQGVVYEKVTTNDGLESGDYLIVYEDGSKAFDGSLLDLEPVGNVFDVTINNNKIVTDKAAYFTIDTNSGTIYSASGYYIGRTASGNGFNQSDSEAYTHTITIDNSGNAIITSSGGPKLQMWSQTSSGVMQYRFRYYTSNQKAIQLYRRQGGSTVVSAPVITPEGGTANKRFESVELTMTAAEGCTIYYTTDGTVPTQESSVYNAEDKPMLPYGSAPTTVKAIAVDGEGNTSSVTTVVYYWDKATVTITPASQSVGGNVDVTIAATPAEATVVYTVNGGAQQPYNGQFQVIVDEENPEVTVIAYATMGQSEATDTATYTFKDLGVNSIAEFLALSEGDSAYFKNPVVVLFDYSQNSSNGQEYIWVKDRTGYTQIFVAPVFKSDTTAVATDGDGFWPKYENGDVIPAGFKVKKAHYGTGDYYQGQCYATHSTFQDATEKALADPEQVTLTELLNSIPASTDETSVYNNRYLYINKLKLSNISGLNFRIAADEDGNGTAEIEGGTDIVGYNKYNSPAWKNKQGQTVGVELPTDGAFYNVKFIFQKWSSGYEIMPIEFTKWEETSLRLEDLVEVGVENNQYTISNQLIAAAVTWDADQEMFAIFAKDDEMYASKSVPADGMKNYLISYKNQDGSFVNTVEQKDYDQSNWIEILIPTEIISKITDPNAYQAKLDELKEDYENKFLKAGTVKGTYVDTLNPTIRTTSNNLPVAESEYEYAPNIFCTANFLMENLDSDGATSYRDDEFGGQYFMMDGKPQEFCKVVWAFFEHTDNYFVAPAQEADTINGHNFHGSFLADMSLCEDSWVIEDSPLNYFTASNATTPEKLFGFRAIVRKNPESPVWASKNGAPHRIQPSTESPKEQNPAYIVYPLNSETSSTDNVTAVTEVKYGMEVVSVRYYNIMGMESETPFEGINIMVTRYSDGSTTSCKVLR